MNRLVLTYACGCRDSWDVETLQSDEMVCASPCVPSVCWTCSEASPCETRRNMPPAYTHYEFEDVKPVRRPWTRLNFVTP